MADTTYSWKPSSEVTLDDFLQKCKPTMVVDDGTKPWIWVRRVEHEPLDAAKESDEDYHGDPAVERAKNILDEYTEKIVAIQKDDSIPVRANKKKGLRSKKEVREEVMAEATEKLKETSQESKLTCGKWLFFAQPEHIDSLFARLARDLVDGALSHTPAFLAKVATTPADVGPNHRYLVCLYLPDLYDKAAATEVLRAVCKSIGVRPNSAKADIYTLIGLDSKHPSGIKSTIWNPHDLIPDAELKALTEAYWADASKKATTKGAEPASSPTAAADGAPKKQSTTKRKVEDSDDDDVFASVEDSAVEKDSGASGKTESKPAPKAETAPTSDKPLEPTGESANDTATESESDDPPPVKSAPKPIQKAAQKSAKPKVQDDGSSSEDDAPKKPKKIRRF
ncbi:hypothetical protein BDV93DRAFT_486827 [Ceratobasidium sp. AG-I]|nr:hypothetical protein BDV93DRAFT_486827 [Ceratobasidium sp. AG-I]